MYIYILYIYIYNPEGPGLLREDTVGCGRGCINVHVHCVHVWCIGSCTLFVTSAHMWCYHTYTLEMFYVTICGRVGWGAPMSMWLFGSFVIFPLGNFIIPTDETTFFRRGFSPASSGNEKSLEQFHDNAIENPTRSPLNPFHIPRNLSKSHKQISSKSHENPKPH